MIQLQSNLARKKKKESCGLCSLWFLNQVRSLLQFIVRVHQELREDSTGVAFHGPGQEGGGGWGGGGRQYCKYLNTFSQSHSTRHFLPLHLKAAAPNEKEKKYINLCLCGQSFVSSLTAEGAKTLNL